MDGSFLGYLLCMCGFFASLIVIMLFGLSAAASAEEINYVGDGRDLRDGPLWLSGDFIEFLFPGTEEAAISSGNIVTINYDPADTNLINPEFVAGGIGESENTVDNRVTLLNGQVNEKMFGGFSCYGDAVDNTAALSGGSSVRMVYGGFCSNGSATGNTVAMDGGYVSYAVCGGVSDDGDATGNTAAINNGSVKGGVYGGYSYFGDAARNSVTISGGSVTAIVYGGWSRARCAADNSVTISGGSVADDVYGGATFLDDSPSTGNRVTISGGAVKGCIFGGRSEDGDSTGNFVTISGGAVTGYVLGGLCSGGKSVNNTVAISGKPDLAESHVYGGQTDVSFALISRKPNLTKLHLRAGQTDARYEDSFTGNTLKFKSSGISVMGVGNFEYYNFELPQDLTANLAMLNVTDKVNLAKTTVAISLQGRAMFKKNDNIALIKSVEGVSGSPKNTDCQVKHDGVLYEFSIYTDKNNLWAQVAKISDTAK